MTEIVNPEEKREPNNVGVCFEKLCGRVSASDLADAAGVESMRGYLTVILGGCLKFIGEHEGEEVDDRVYVIDVMNRRGPQGEHCRLWLSRAELLDLYEQLGRVVDPDYEKKVMERMNRRTP